MEADSKWQIQAVRLYIFQEKGIRRVWYNEEWFYFMLDVVDALAETPNSREYFLKKMSQLDEQPKFYVGTNCPQAAIGGVKVKMEYAILTAEISRASFGLTPNVPKNLSAPTNPQKNYGAARQH